MVLHYSMLSRLPVTAVGNSSVIINSGTAVSTLLIKGSLLSPVAVTPVYALGPSGHSSPGCATASEAGCTFSAPFYTNQTGNGITAMPSQDFTALLVNTAVGYQAGCMSGSGFGTGLNPTPVTGLMDPVCCVQEASFNPSLAGGIPSRRRQLSIRSPSSSL